MKLTATMFQSADGVVQGPGGPGEDTSGGFTRGGWVAPHIDPVFGEQVSSWFSHADAFLLGRHTYEIFAGYWPKVTDTADPVAGPLNARPKYVVTRTLSTVDWPGASIVEGDPAAGIRAVKEQPGDELQVHGSPTLVRFLLAEGLLDELRLITFPVIVGAGRRLFPESGPDAALALLEAKPTGAGAVIHTYAIAGPPVYGDLT
jgi:dihydrofolate reductase